MARPRKHNTGLPPCVYLRRGVYFYVKKNKWHRLGTDFATALIEYGKLAHKSLRRLKPTSSIIAQSMVVDRTSGVYFLIKEGAVVYIGSSTNISARIVTHQCNGVDFDRVFFIPAPQSEIIDLEARYIGKIKPPLNIFRPARWPAKKKPTTTWALNTLSAQEEARTGSEF